MQKAEAQFWGRQAGRSPRHSRAFEIGDKNPPAKSDSIRFDSGWA